MNDNVTFEQLSTAIEVWNMMKVPGRRGQGSFAVHDILAGSELFAREDTVWFPVTVGPLAGSRYCKTKFGFVVQAREPSNEMSLIQESMAKMMGIGVESIPLNKPNHTTTIVNLYN